MNDDKFYEDLKLAIVLLFLLILSAVTCHYVYKDEEAKRQHEIDMQRLKVQEQAESTIPEANRTDFLQQ